MIEQIVHRLGSGPVLDKEVVSAIRPQLLVVSGIPHQKPKEEIPNLDVAHESKALGRVRRILRFINSAGVSEATRG
jgi:hypothetical protein